jgi:hypothetical protein
MRRKGKYVDTFRSYYNNDIAWFLLGLLAGMTILVLILVAAGAKF